ncbi:MAG: DUF5706 domain-containing protein [Oscillospiraceae bacterium]|nr:DUF5706 domain-containing protein [Oscillospiraceae bacterium]
MENSEDGKSAISTILENTFSNVNHWLGFAEAKNAALIAFNIAVLSAVLGSADVLNKNLLYYIVNCILIISSGMALISFEPKRGNNNRMMRSNTDADNLLLFSHIAKYTKEKYLIEVYRRYLNVIKREEDLSRMELDYADEITYNAQIAVNKYTWFKRALYADIGGMCCMFALVVIA